MSPVNNNFTIFGKNVKIWHFANIYGTKIHPVVIGSNTHIASYCEIKPGVTIGEYCRIHAYVFISEETQIGNHVFVGPRVIFLNDKYPTTATAGTHSWHNTPPRVSHHVVIGGGAIIGPGVSIGKYAFVGMGAVVTKNVRTFEIVVGNPAKVIGKVTDYKYRTKFKIPK